VKASEWLAQLGESWTKARQEKIVQAAADMQMLPIIWKDVVIHLPGCEQLVLQVSHDALRFGEYDDFVRINCSALDAQLIADIYDARLPTEKISDLVHVQAEMTIEPCLSKGDAGMASSSRMLWHSQAVSKKIGVLEFSACPFVNSVGKDWVLTNHYPKNHGANYGWHTKTRPNPEHPEWGPFPCRAGGYVFQPRGTTHDIWHTDYSQVLRLVHRYAHLVNGDDVKELELDDVLTRADLAPFVSYEGPLKYVRHPNIPKQ